MIRGAAGPLLLLAALGAGWGATQPLAKIAVSEGYAPFGLIFWQVVIGVVVLGGYSLIRGRGIPFGRAQLRIYLVLALIGTVLPNTASYTAAKHLPAGILSILLSLVPMFAFPIALAMSIERFSWLRLSGLCLGLAGVVLIVGPEASLPDRAMAAFIPIALIAPLFYGLEGNVVARWGTAGVGPIRALAGASLVGVVITGPLALASGQWIDPRPPWGAPDIALILGSVIHAFAYAAYVWLVGRAGPVFAVQVGYLVTGFGVFWAMLILGESYSGWIWAAMALMLAGVFLVQPRPTEALAEVETTGNNTP